MAGHTIWTLQVAQLLPEGADPADFPSLARLEDHLRTIVAEDDTTTVASFTVTPGAVHSYLVATLDLHRAQPDGSSCFCGWQPGSDGVSSWAEHVAERFEEGTRAHAIV